MNRQNLKKLCMNELIKLFVKAEASKPVVTPPVPAPRMVKPVPKPRKSVKQMLMDLENKIIPLPLQFRDDYKPVAAPHTQKKQCLH